VTFGQLLRLERCRVGLTQESLADAVGLHRTHVSCIERGKRDPGLETLVLLARGLGMTAGELVARWARRDERRSW
jgi:transcriptional regulator with XRE-family HTH domain